jgi:MADS-box transcription factor
VEFYDDELKLRHRIGEGGMELEELSFQQLRSLEEDMNSSIAKIRERKVKYYF